MRLWKSCLRDRTRKGKYFSRKGIKALWPQPKNDEMEGVRVVYDHPPRRPRLPETLSVNRNNGPEDTFSIFPCCHYSVKSLSDVVTCHTEVCTSKEERRKVRMDLPARVLSWPGCRRVCRPRPALPASLPRRGAAGGGQQGQPLRFSFFHPQHLIPDQFWLEMVTKAKYFPTDTKALTKAFIYSSWIVIT